MTATTSPSVPRGCVIVPAYREAGRIEAVVRAIRAHVDDVIVVDDGSPDDTGREAGAAGATVIRHAVNLGKGAALASAFRAAIERGFDYVITMDGDGQHAPEDIPRFIETYLATGLPVLVGNRMCDTRSMPLIRRLTNRFMSWLLSREMRQRVPDTQCGYRLYNLAVVSGVAIQSPRFAAESEILMDLSDRGIRIGAVPVATLYGTEQSKIHPVKDSVLFFNMLRRYRKIRQKRS
jgi:glycosyltransferase involved in cell wall biosynthesis